VENVFKKKIAMTRRRLEAGRLNLIQMIRRGPTLIPNILMNQPTRSPATAVMIIVRVAGKNVVETAALANLTNIPAMARSRMKE